MAAWDAFDRTCWLRQSRLHWFLSCCFSSLFLVIPFPPFNPLHLLSPANDATGGSHWMKRFAALIFFHAHTFLLSGLPRPASFHIWPLVVHRKYDGIYGGISTSV